MDIRRWQDDPSVQAALQHLTDIRPIIDTAIAIQQVPAPTFDEGRRGALVAERFSRLGLSDVERDSVGNVYGRRPGRAGGAALLIAAHIDTVFPLETDLAVRYEGDRIYGPGLGDNSLGVAGLLHLAQAFQEYDLPNPGDIWFVGDVGEEGLGDLRGMRVAVERLRPQLGAAIALEGCDFGKLHHQAIGVRRYRIDVTAPGGHSWGDFGSPSAIHVLVRIAAQLTELSPATDPRTTFNIGVISGGTSVNTIAEEASLLLDMRSVEMRALDALVRRVDVIIAAEAARHDRVRVRVTTVGDRPAGAIPRSHPLVQAATAAYRASGAIVSYVQSSTDANIPLSEGIPAVCVGLTDGRNAHRQDEYILPANLGRGMQALLLLALAASA
ncbi:MAG: M20/M25/M40 family metallo-hydrolase [Chloroflexaceae bacterium]